MADRGTERVDQCLDDNGHQELMSLPKDWWQQSRCCEVLSSLLIEFMLGFYLSAEVEETTQQAFYTGFLLEAEDQLVWVTAGHVMEQINDVLSREDIVIKDMRWMDGYPVSGAESVLVHDRRLRTGSLHEDRVDFGFIGLSLLDAANIRQNPDIKTMPPDAWQVAHDTQSEAYFLLGFPEESFAAEPVALSGGRRANRVTANLSIIPVRRLEYPDHPPEIEFWNDSGAFYGELIGFTDTNRGQPTSIKGMSGGPLVSFDRDSERGLVWRLLGIQSKWLPESRVICVEPMARVFDVIEKRLQESGGAI